MFFSTQGTQDLTLRCGDWRLSSKDNNELRDHQQLTLKDIIVHPGNNFINLFYYPKEQSILYCIQLFPNGSNIPRLQTMQQTFVKRHCFSWKALDYAAHSFGKCTSKAFSVELNLIMPSTLNLLIGVKFSFVAFLPQVERKWKSFSQNSSVWMFGSSKKGETYASDSTFYSKRLISIEVKS